MITAGIIGYGYWGPNLVRNIWANPEINLFAVCDKNVKRLAELKRQYPSVDTITDCGQIIKSPDIQAVMIATPVPTHYEMAKKSLLAGKHTFIEKPMARSTAECEELIELAEEKKLTLMTGHTFIYSPVVRKIREIIDSGILGDIQYISSRRLNLGIVQNDINVAWDLAPHDLSIILYLLKDKPVSVNCQGMAHLKEGIEDVTNMTLEFPNSGFATIHSSWLDPNKVREMTIVGTRKMLVYDDIQPIEKIKIYDKRVENPPYYKTFGEFQFSYHYGDIHSPYIKQSEPLELECQHFIDCINTGVKPESSGYEGLEVVRILEAASESLHKGGACVALSDEAATVEPILFHMSG
ncbi:MAG: Gfo/Idh/MocA family protein [bacterium]|jgi:predicted dehydrogenase